VIESVSHLTSSRYPSDCSGSAGEGEAGTFALQQRNNAAGRLTLSDPPAVPDLLGEVKD
jgi:hypothetical protein